MKAARTKAPTAWEIVRLALALGFFAAAPTAGDIGSCGQAENDLDPQKFFSTKQDLDCQRCQECVLTTRACERACEKALIVSDFPAGCVPIEHDGEVCVDALAAASCGDYARYMDDEAATIPTECNFCPAMAADAGAE
jgi:hypothetical protein